ncbi:hypothetical protein [Variovorax sp. Sphag1AA]|uniref:hypothetical protein n=1 Tax=Variovorax sp. Sphag1AA TaxID=2587027 RepID=UPI001620C93C|nr:hypothetical protein [Variovorax sp. Sphag1AA]MBB3181998.1 hypothetical protein [Variovorax sp. Sphag1AA]
MMNLTEPAAPHRQFFAPQRPRSSARQDLLRRQVGKLLERLQRIGVKCAIAGSFAREAKPLVAGSDVEVLILDDAGLRDFRIWEIAWDEVSEADVNLVFARDVTQGGLLRPKA